MKQIFKSQLQDVEAFKKAVAEYIDTLHAFNKKKGEPRPSAHPMIEQSINRIQVKGKPDTYVPNYEIIDDTPDASVTLEMKKSDLIRQLNMAEQAAYNKVYPIRKRRLLGILHGEALSAPEDVRTAEQSAMIKKVEDVNKAFHEIGKKVAMAEAAIDDLTADNVDSWQLPNLE